MTKNHVKKRCNKDHPGCMGGLFSMFDFHQHPSGRKLIADKAHSAGADSSRISFDVENKSLETSQNRDAKNEYGFLKNPSTKKKAGGLPMKALIAEEMSKEFESKRRAPGVVARLMGLEAMPAEPMLEQQTQELDNDPQKNISVKQVQQPKSIHDGRNSPQKSRASAQEISLLVSQQKTANRPDQRVQSCTQDQSREKQRQDLEKEFEALQVLKYRDCSKTEQLDDLSMQLVEKHMLVHERLDESKMAHVRQKFIDAKNLATDEKLQQSNEFLDALEVLQSNKDMFLKFLQEPNSLFAKHLQDLQSSLKTPETTKTKTKSGNVFKTSELKMDDINHGRYPTEGKMHDKQLQKQKGPRSLTETEEEWRVRSSSSGTKDQYKQYSTASAPVKIDACSLPTRIVVLKPGPGSAQNARPQSPPSWSPRSETAFRSLGEGDRASTKDFLNEVRERLKMGLKENRKDDSKISQDGVRGRINDDPKDPREIAREIARQVRESVARDLTNGPSDLGELSPSFTNFIGKRSSLNGSRTSSGEVSVSSDTEVSTPVTVHSVNSTKRFGILTSQPSSKSRSAESTVNREAKKRLSERLKLSHVDEEKQHSGGMPSTLGKILALQEDKKPICRPKSPKDNNKINNGIEESQCLSGQVRHDVGTDCTYHRDGDENGDIISPKSFVRARSGPLLSVNFDKDKEDMKCRISDVTRDNAHEMVVNSSSTNLPTEIHKTKSDGSILEGKASSLGGSFLMMGKRSSSWKCDSLMEPDTNFQVPLDEICELPKEVHVESESNKRSIGAPGMEYKQFKFSADVRSAVAPVDTEGPEEIILEPLDWEPATSGLSDALQSADRTHSTTEVVPPDQPPLSSPTSCSPTNRLSHQEPKASAITNEKAEQPSPVSVLDSPFQEETPSPKDFKKISSDLQELRLRLRLLKFDGSEKPTHKADNSLQGDGIESQDHDFGEADIVSERTSNSSSETVLTSASKLQSPITENVDFESLQLDDISCPNDKQSNLCYVRNVLVASGFTGAGIFARWHLPDHPLDPSLFEKIEDLHGYDNEVGKTEALENQWERRLLFDCINEVLLEILGPFFNHHPWLEDTKLNLRRMPAGKQLLRATWAAISHAFYMRAETQDTLENIIAKDMAKGRQWMELQNDAEAVGCQVERAILSDLIEETIFDLVL